MTNTVDPVDQMKLTNSFYRSICPWRDKPQNGITREDKEHLSPPGRKGFEHSVTAEDIFINPTEEDKKIFHNKWVNEIYAGKKSQDELIAYLLKREFTEEQAQEIINNSLDNVDRQKDWSEYNETNGKTASQLMNGAIALGIASKLLDSESVPKTLRTVVNFTHGAALGARSKYQGSIYNSRDDDASKNRFEAEMYGGEAVGKMANGAMIVETKVRFWAQPLVELLPEPLKSIGKAILPLFSSAWWRGRMASAINHEFLTDLLRFMLHKLLSLLGRKKSIKVVEGIKERKNLDLPYVMERHYKNAGLTDKKDQKLSKLISQIFKLLKNSFSSDIGIKKDSTKKLSETIAPTFGIYGLFAVTVGALSKVILKILNKEENRIIDYLSSSGVLSQQAIYLFKLVNPLQIEVEELRNTLSNPETLRNYSKKEIEQRKDLFNKKRKLSYMGYGCFIVNALNTFLKLKNFENPYLKTAVNILDEIASNLIPKFFSHRRYLKGYEFRIENPEYYEENNAQEREANESGSSVHNDLTLVSQL